MSVGLSASGWTLPGVDVAIEWPGVDVAIEWPARVCVLPMPELRVDCWAESGCVTGVADGVPVAGVAGVADGVPVAGVTGVADGVPVAGVAGVADGVPVAGQLALLLLPECLYCSSMPC